MGGKPRWRAVPHDLRPVLRADLKSNRVVVREDHVRVCNHCRMPLGGKYWSDCLVEGRRVDLCDPCHRETFPRGRVPS